MIYTNGRRGIVLDVNVNTGKSKVYWHKQHIIKWCSWFRSSYMVRSRWACQEFRIRTYRLILNKHEAKTVRTLGILDSKLSHNGITSYKQFEHCGRRMHKHSLLNLVQTVIPTDTRNLNETQSRKNPVHYVKN